MGINIYYSELIFISINFYQQQKLMKKIFIFEEKDKSTRKKINRRKRNERETRKKEIREMSNEKLKNKNQKLKNLTNNC